MAANKDTLDGFRRATARRLRGNQTGPERRLWRQLRQFPIEGTHFRRQVPIGDYVADFACMTSRLVIEVDGSQHYLPEGKAKDEVRTAWLESEGYRVLRFSNKQIIENLKGVMDAVYAAVFGSLKMEPIKLAHRRHRRAVPVRSPDHPTPARTSGARRPSPSRGG